MSGRTQAWYAAPVVRRMHGLDETELCNALHSSVSWREVAQRALRQSTRETYPDVADLLDAGDVTGAAEAFLGHLEGGDKPD